VRELEQPSERTVVDSSSQTPPSGNWLEGYFAVWIGMLLVMAVTVPVLVFVAAVVLLSQALLGEELGLGVASIAIAPVWIWFAFRFFFPTMLQIIWIDGRPALFALHRVTVRRMIGVVTAQLSVLRLDLRSLSTRIGNWLNA
jgi:hypothetical protein